MNAASDDRMNEIDWLNLSVDSLVLFTDWLVPDCGLPIFMESHKCGDCWRPSTFTKVTEWAKYVVFETMR
jgi:hypothetical protein